MQRCHLQIAEETSKMKLQSFAPILVLVIILAGCLAQAADSDDSSVANKLPTWKNRPQWLDFSTYQKLYHKTYASYSELVRRSGLFYARMMRIFLVGIKYLHKQSTVYLRPNELSDETEEKRMKIFSDGVAPIKDNNATRNGAAESIDEEQTASSENRPTPATNSNQEETSRLAEAIGASAGPKEEHVAPIYVDLSNNDRKGQTEVFLDYRDTGCITPIKHQRECGACYIFCIFAVYEYLHCTQRGKPVVFSEQYAIDCGKRELKSSGMNGCDGGREDYVAYFAANYGLEHESSLPFKAQEDTCPYAIGVDKSRMGQTRVRHTAFGFNKDAELRTAKELERVLQEYGPFSIGVHLDRDLVEYGGGIAMMSSCIKPYGHGMTVVGHGIDDGHEYFLIKNSMGAEWGEQGYYRLSKHFNPACLMHFTYIQAEFTDNDGQSTLGAQKSAAGSTIAPGAD